jgi:TetR/AcrR family transcriptional regulator, transcriptional repressor of aconitase
MPKVDDKHREARRAQILEAARRCFARKGFAETSITDIVAESGLSAGAIYSYFDGKPEIIRAVAETMSGKLLASLDAEALDGLPDRLKQLAKDEGHARVIAQVWGQGATSEPLRSIVRQTHATVLAQLTEVIEFHRAAGSLPPGPPAATVAEPFLALCSGYSLLLAVDLDVDPEPFRKALNAVLRQGA